MDAAKKEALKNWKAFLVIFKNNYYYLNEKKSPSEGHNNGHLKKEWLRGEVGYRDAVEI